MKKGQWLLAILLCLSSLNLSAETRRIPKLAVLPTTDLTKWGLAEALQYSLGKLAVSTKLFAVGSSTFVLQDFSKRELKKAFQSNRSPLLMFAYIESERVSVFFFNAYQSGKFIVGSRSLAHPPSGKVSSVFVETQFKEAFDETITLFQRNQYQDLPKVEGDIEGDFLADSVGQEVSKSNADKMRALFQEVSRLEDKPLYFGANIGMARYTSTNNAASTVNFGFSAGGRFNHRVSASLGVDLFSYIFAHGDAFYRLPLAEKYISFSAIGSIGNVMGSLTENKGYAVDGATLKTGSLFFGPGLAIDIPLLGASLRGELRLYLGSSYLLVGSYGLIVSI